MKKTILFLLLMLTAGITSTAAHKSPRIRDNFDFDWKFILGDNPEYSSTDFNNSGWEEVQLPHDWNIKQAFDSKGQGSAAYLPEGKGWYRKTFTIPKNYKGKEVSIIFDGIFMQSDVYINGHHLGFHPYGFTSVIYDLTPYLKDGENTIAVKVDTTGGRPRWYSGAGIYRHAWLQATNPIHISDYGTYITTPSITNSSATIDIVSTVANNSDKVQTVTVENMVIGPDGKGIGKPVSGKVNVNPGGKSDLKQTLNVANPLLWDVETPNMYSMQTKVKAGGKVVDIYDTPFGIRTDNYLEARMLSEKKIHPERMCYISEELPYYRGEEGNIRSYTPLNPWQIVKDNDFVAGGFLWSGVDYLGEAGWPSKGWPAGLFDICMNEKPRAAYHRAMWNKTPMVSIAVVDPSLDIDHGRDLWQWPNMASIWNFPNRYCGLVMEIRTTTNCESVELLLNDKPMGKHKTDDFTNNTIVWCLPYQPGKLKAIGYNGDEAVADYQIVTAGNTEKANIKADRTTINADGHDLSHISIELLDKDGNFVQTDDRRVTVTVDGDLKFLGLDSGDLRREKTFSGNELKTYFGKALAIVQSTRKKGKGTVTIKIEGVAEPAVLEINTI